MAGNPDYDKQWKDLQVPFDEEAGTYLRAKSITQASLAKAGFVYDEDQDAMVSTTDGVGLPGRRRQGQLHQRGRGAAAAGLARQRRLRQLHQAATDETLRTRFLPITAWTFFFAIMTTFLTSRSA